MTDWPENDHWIDRHDDVVREAVWRSEVYGTEYIDLSPRDALDEEIGHRDTTTTRGTLLGMHPELGTVVYGNNESILTHVEHVTIKPTVYISTR